MCAIVCLLRFFQKLSSATPLSNILDPRLIRLRAWDFYEVIVDEGEAWVDYSLIDNKGELSNCFSRIKD